MNARQQFQVLALILTTALAGCGGNNTVTSNAASNSNDASANNDPNKLVAAALAGGAPVAFNYSQAAKPGDTVSVQGVNLANTTVKLSYIYNGTTYTAVLPILNSYADSAGTSEISVQIPLTANSPSAGTPVGNALSLTLTNSAGSSAALKLNQAQPYNMDAVSYVPGAPFRLFGRNLYLTSGTPKVYFVTTAGVTYNFTVNRAASTERMIVGTVSSSLPVGSTGNVYVVNGNGSGGLPLQQTISIIASPTGAVTDPFGLNVGWASAFGLIAQTVIDPTSNPNVNPLMVGDGVTDNRNALQSAINYANSLQNGATIDIPAGNYLIENGLNLPSNVVIEGAGIGQTILNFAPTTQLGGANAINSRNSSSVGLMNLTLNFNTNLITPDWQADSQIFLKNIQINAVNTTATGSIFALWLTNNTNVLITGSSFINLGVNASDDLNLQQNNGMVVTNNTFEFSNGSAVGTDGSQNMYFAQNNFIRDVSTQNTSAVTHGLSINFDKNITVDSNNFSVINGTLANPATNDGEAILTEGGGPDRTEAGGVVTAATRTTLSDTTSGDTMVDLNFPFTTYPLTYGSSYTPVNYSVVIVAGAGTGQKRDLVNAVAATQPVQKITLSHPWAVVPNKTSHYATFVLGIENGIISNNTFNGWPRGTWIYDASTYNLDLVNNSYTAGGGIYIRSDDEISTVNGGQTVPTYHVFTPMLNVNVVGNTITNPSGVWSSYIGNMFFVGTSESPPFGFGSIGVIFKGNSVTENVNEAQTGFAQSAYYYINQGYFNAMYSVAYPYSTPVTSGIIGTIFQSNTCSNCPQPVVTGVNVSATDYIDMIINAQSDPTLTVYFDKTGYPASGTSSGNVVIGTSQ